MPDDLVFNPPPGWPTPPPGWTPPLGWTPDPSWPDPPDGWELWLPAETPEGIPASEPSTKHAVPEQTSEPPKDDAPFQSPDGWQPEQPSATGLDPHDELGRIRAEIEAARQELADLNDERVLQQVGIYRYHHLVGDGGDGIDYLHLRWRARPALNGGTVPGTFLGFLIIRSTV